MTLDELRVKHPRFIYKSYGFERFNDQLKISFSFKIEPDIDFYPEITIEMHQGANLDEIENLVFHLGLIESISYWKATCSTELYIEAGNLTQDQIDWWKDLFINGLGEFFFQNKIDFSKPNLVNIVPNKNKESFPSLEKELIDRDLILVAGGKDSSASLEMLKESQKQKKVLILNPTRASTDAVKIAGYKDILVVKREIDPKLLKLNKQGYLNGHTPFSAYLAFLSVLTSAIYNYRNIIVSNERSAGEGNINYHGIQVNHQYSKSFYFEQLFRQYSQKYLTKKINYFSFLRPLYDLQISKIFSKFGQHHFSFRSCNVGQKQDSWCGNCAKCAFVYLSLAPFLDFEKMIKMFGSDFFEKKELEIYFRALIGLGQHKPFECVGTEEESKLAAILSLKKYRDEKKEVPETLLMIENEISIDVKKMTILKENILNGWDEDNFLSEEYQKLLKSYLN